MVKIIKFWVQRIFLGIMDGVCWNVAQLWSPRMTEQLGWTDTSPWTCFIKVTASNKAVLADTRLRVIFLRGSNCSEKDQSPTSFCCMTKGENSWLVSLSARIVSHPITVSNDLYTFMVEYKRYLSNRSWRMDSIELIKQDSGSAQFSSHSFEKKVINFALWAEVVDQVFALWIG